MPSGCFQLGQHLFCTLLRWKSNSLAHATLEKLLSPKLGNMYACTGACKKFKADKMYHSLKQTGSIFPHECFSAERWGLILPAFQNNTDMRHLNGLLHHQALDSLYSVFFKNWKLYLPKREMCCPLCLSLRCCQRGRFHLQRQRIAKTEMCLKGLPFKQEDTIKARRTGCLILAKKAKLYSQVYKFAQVCFRGHLMRNGWSESCKDE